MAADAFAVFSDGCENKTSSAMLNERHTDHVTTSSCDALGTIMCKGYRCFSR
jgi:hypothetical protein